ncbi:hypothetical protein O0L34_g8860 [Tuta absoluta]|nr:hypothetical protein O0L34_g8860 [Tuta absoluta]
MFTEHQAHTLKRRSLQTCRVTARRKPAAYLRDRTQASVAGSSPTRTDDAVAARVHGRAPAGTPPPPHPPRLRNASHTAQIKLREPDRVPFLTRSTNNVSANRYRYFVGVDGRCPTTLVVQYVVIW